MSLFARYVPILLSGVPGSGGGGGGGTVTDVSVATANGFSASVANPTTTPLITLQTTITGILQGNGTAISAATIGNLTDAGTDGITITGGTGAILGTGTSIAQHVADTTHNGYLSSADWNTFNSKQAAGNYITALTGDGTATGPGSAALTLATVNGSPGSFGDASHSLSATVNGKGLITALSAQSIQIAESQVTNLVADLASKVATASLGNLTDAGTDGITVTGGTGAVVGAVSLSQHVADTTHNGYLSSTDWNTFNNKQSTLTLGNLTDVGTDGITITGGTGAVVGSGTSIAQHVADATHNGYLSSTDWNTFSGTSGAAITSLTGDVTATGPGAAAATLATVNGSPGSFGDASHSLAATVNGKGLITALSAQSIQIAESQVTGLTADLASKVATASLGNLTDAGTDGIVVTGGTGAVVGSVSLAQHVADATHNGYLSSTDWNTFNSSSGAAITSLTGDATATGPGAAALTLATVNANVGSFGSSTSIPSFTVNAKGLITAASGNVVIAPAGTLSGTTLNSTVVSSSLTSVGTIAAGTWQGTPIAIAYGGTGQTTANAGFDALSPMTTAGDIIYENATPTAARLGIGSTGQVLTVVGGLPAWASPATSGTVTSVALADGSTTPIYAITGSPVTSSGTLTFTLDTQSANTVFAGPTTGAAAQPTFRALVAADLPAGTGTVTSVSVVSANGLAGTVANATTTPAITLSTTITGILQGNGTAISAASTTGSGAVVLATSPTLVTPTLGAASATSLALTNALTVPNGGTGNQSFTANQVVLGGTTTTGALQQVAGGTSGYVLTSTGTTSAPTWQAFTPSFPTETANTSISGSCFRFSSDSDIQDLSSCRHNCWYYGYYY